MFLRTVIAGAFTLALSVGAAQAAPIDVSYTVTGSAGNWTYDFTVKNNLPAPFNTYAFGAAFANDQITTSPSGWVDFSTIFTLPFTYPGLSQPYNNVWRVGTPFLASIPSGGTLSGFEAHDTGTTPLASLDWFAFDAALLNPTAVDTSVLYSGPGCSMNCGPGSLYNPGFQGTAVAAVAATPLPPALPLLAASLGGLTLFGWKRGRKAA